MTRWKGCSACNNLTAGIHKSNLTNLKLLSQTDKNDIGDGVGCQIKWQHGCSYGLAFTVVFLLANCGLVGGVAQW